MVRPETPTTDPVEVAARAGRLERRQNWHLLAIATPVVLSLVATAVGYGRLDGRVVSLEAEVDTLRVAHLDQIAGLNSSNLRQWDAINDIGPVLADIAADVAYLRGLYERGSRKEN
jgi:hypothetical protein